MSRSVPEWIGKTDNTPVPPRVALRVFQNAGERCHCCGTLIRSGMKWQTDHIKALINGGENREKNLGPILDACHKVKTGADVDEKSKTYRMARNNAGLKPKGRGWNTKLKRKMSGEVVPR